MAAEVDVVVIVVENGSITGEVESGPSDCDAESNRCEVKISSVNTSIAVVSIVRLVRSLCCEHTSARKKYLGTRTITIDFLHSRSKKSVLALRFKTHPSTSLARIVAFHTN